jgi:hypothetical protein
MEVITEMAGRRAKVEQKEKQSSQHSKKKRGGKKRNAAASSSGVPAWMMTSMNAIDYELDDYDYGMLNLGFSQGDIEELMYQGIKPWDDDAWVSHGFHQGSKISINYA